MKKNLHVFTAALLVASCTFVNAQNSNNSRCSTTEHMEWLKTQDPGLEARMQAAEQASEQWLAANPNARVSGTTIIIPTIVHVLYNSAAQNISDDMIKSQIDVLNEDFGGYNSDHTKVPPFFRGVKAGDTGIRFQLATRDPLGAATTGIRRISTSVTSWSTNNNIKFTSMGGDDAWPCGSYLNIWVGNLGSGLLGYAQFPGGACNTDGVVCLYSAFGRVSPISAYNYGRTATHEIGHWVNLRHINGDSNCGNDLVADTPPQSQLNFGCPSCHAFTCSNQPTGDMFMNYMDYTDDKCMVMFSAGQSARITACMNSTRASLQTSLGCNIVTSPTLDAGITEIISPTEIPCNNTTVTFIPAVTLKNFGTTTLTSVTINSKTDAAGTTVTFPWTGSLAAGATVTVSLASVSTTAGDHIFYCWTSSPNGGTDLNLTNDRTTRNFIGHAVNTPYPLLQGFEVLPFAPTGWSNRNYDCGTGWARSTTVAHSGSASAYFNNFSATATQNGVMDELTTQPVDLTSAGGSAALSFWIAYAPKSATAFDTLEVFISTDCGVNFSSIFKKWGTALATAPATTSNFAPTAAQWRIESISLASFVGQKNAIFVFRNTNHGGNNLYIDDIGNSTVGISENIDGASINIYPNPTNGLLNVSTQFENPEQMQIIVTNALGQMVFSSAPKITSGELSTIDLSNEPNGIYFLELRTSGGRFVRKISLNN
ncbi:MAG: T9SS type A sorting domain-containing protein [Bacteroidia bacterium]